MSILTDRSLLAEDGRRKRHRPTRIRKSRHVDGGVVPRGETSSGVLSRCTSLTSMLSCHVSAHAFYLSRGDPLPAKTWECTWPWQGMARATHERPTQDERSGSDTLGARKRNSLWGAAGDIRQTIRVVPIRRDEAQPSARHALPVESDTPVAAVSARGASAHSPRRLPVLSASTARCSSRCARSKRRQSRQPTA